jgi:subtilisin family serine protease
MFVRLLLACLLILCSTAPATAATSSGPPPPPRSLRPSLQPGGQAYAPGVLVVKFRDPVDSRTRADLQSGSPHSGQATFDALLQRHGVQRAEPVSKSLRNAAGTGGAGKRGSADLGRIFILHYDDATDALDVARQFDALAEIEYAEPLFVYPIDYTPNDSSWLLQSAYLGQMQLPAAWDIHHDSSAIVIAIVDGGTRWDHEDLAANVWSNPGEVLDGTDTDGNGYVDDVRGWNFANGTNDPTGLPQTPISASHGTHVAGIACARFDNMLGIAGASANAHFMPVCAAHPTSDRAISFGYQGIIYAVDNGADIINCSWGGQGNPSSFEQDVIQYAWQNDVVVVAAAGNNNNSASHYPSSYEHVLSVANVDNNDVRSASSNYGPDVDVSAQGQGILSTIDTPTGDGYGSSTGTSMASPHAAAVAAMVQAQYPGYTADQVAQRVRVTADNIDAQNPGYVGQLGFGRVDAQQALTMTTPAITITQRSLITSNGDAVLEPGETASLQLEVTNHLDPATSVDFLLSEDSPYVTIDSAMTALPGLGTLESVWLPTFTLQIDAAAPIQHVVTFTLEVSTAAPSYADASRFRDVVQPVIATHTANQLTTTVTSVGRLGFGLGLGGTGTDGIGFRYQDGDNLLYEGALMIGTADDSLSNAARGVQENLDEDFVTVEGGTPQLVTDHFPYDEFATASFTDADADNPLQIAVVQESWEMVQSPDDDYVTLSYRIRNDGASPLNDLHIGWFFDWDIDGNSYATNQTDYDAGRGLGYAWDSGSGPATYVGMLTLTPPGTTSFRGIWNDETHVNNPSWGIYDGFTNAEKWQAVSGGVVYPQAGPADISFVLGTGPYSVAPGDSILVAFAVLAGDDLVDLQANADAAMALWENPPTDTARTPGPARLSLAQNVPNPFNPQTTIRYDLPHPAVVRLEIFDVRGRRIRTLQNGPLPAGRQSVIWNGRHDDGHPAASGTYFMRLRVDGRSLTRKMQLLK